MTKKELQDRSKAFALSVLRLGACLPQRAEYQVIRNQLIRAATAVGSNYRAACRARSRRDFVSKLGMVEEEADESLFWLELLEGLGCGSPLLGDLLREADELTAIITASRKTARGKRIET